VLIEAHLAEGHLIEARRPYERYRDSVRRELGAGPGEELASLVRVGSRPKGEPYRGVNTSVERLATSRART
jgi:hypothetical protein